MTQISKDNTGAMSELWETDLRVFLALTGLARCFTEHQAGLVSETHLDDALKAVRPAYPKMANSDLILLAQRVEKYRNESICQVALKVAPLRKIISRDEVDDDVVHITLECNHEKDIRAKEFQRMARCKECLKTERAEVEQNLKLMAHS